MIKAVWRTTVCCCQKDFRHRRTTNGEDKVPLIQHTEIRHTVRRVWKRLDCRCTGLSASHLKKCIHAVAALAPGQCIRAKNVHPISSAFGRVPLNQRHMWGRTRRGCSSRVRSPGPLCRRDVRWPARPCPLWTLCKNEDKSHNCTM